VVTFRGFRDIKNPSRNISMQEADNDINKPKLLCISNTMSNQMTTKKPSYWDNHPLYEPPDEMLYDTDIPDSVNWLSEELIEIVGQYVPKDGDIDPYSGESDKIKISNAASAMFIHVNDRTFCNIYQLKQLVQHFASAWGFQVRTANSWQLHCSYGKRLDNYTSGVSPSKQREGQSMKGDCPFYINSSPRYYRELAKQLGRARNPVKVTKTHFEHGPICRPGIESLRIAKKRGGSYMGKLDLKGLSDVVKVCQAGTVTTRQVRNLLLPYLPQGVDISHNDIRNLKARALKIDLLDKEMDREEAEKLIAFKPLDENEQIYMLTADRAQTKTREFLRQILQDSGEGWRVLSFLEKLRQQDPYFEYRVCKTEYGSPTGIVWMTKTMRQAWVAFGTLLSIDLKNKKIIVYTGHILAQLCLTMSNVSFQFVNVCVLKNHWICMHLH
jgi:hypothetical protein